MKFLLALVLIIFHFEVSAQTWKLQKGIAEYTVAHTVKKITGKSESLQGQLKCVAEICEFLVATQIKTFLSSDSNRDLNMLGILEVNTYPLTLAKGTLKKSELTKPKWQMPVEIEFHGIKKSYIAKMKQEKMHIEAELILDLDAHKVDRPSLFTIKIKNEVPITFDLKWDQI